MVLPNRQIARSFFGFAVPGLSGQSAGFVSRFTQSLAGAVLLVLLTLFAVVANAVDQTWDQASGNWNTADTNWTGAAWTNGNTAIFGGTAGTVTLGTGITVGGLTFDTAGYTVAGNTLTFGIAGNIAANADATISSILAGNAITKTGTGTGAIKQCRDEVKGLHAFRY